MFECNTVKRVVGQVLPAVGVVDLCHGCPFTSAANVMAAILTVLAVIHDVLVPQDDVSQRRDRKGPFWVELKDMRALVNLLLAFATFVEQQLTDQSASVQMLVEQSPVNVRDPDDLGLVLIDRIPNQFERRFKRAAKGAHAQELTT